MITTANDARAAARSIVPYVDSPDGSSHCVLIDVLDVGDAWRIYFGRTSPGATSPADAAVSPAPLLLDKATARVRVEDPPTDLSMPTAHDSLKTMLRYEIAPALRALGFVGSGRVFRLPSNTHYATVGFQGSIYSNKAVAFFYINVCVVPKATWDAAAAQRGSTRAPGASTCIGPEPGLYIRANSLNPGDIPDRWSVFQGKPIEPIALRLLDVIRHDVLPTMNNALTTLPY